MTTSISITASRASCPIPPHIHMTNNRYRITFKIQVRSFRRTGLPSRPFRNSGTHREKHTFFLPLPWHLLMPPSFHSGIWQERTLVRQSLAISVSKYLWLHTSAPSSSKKPFPCMPPDLHLAYFYFDFRDVDKQNRCGLLPCRHGLTPVAKSSPAFMSHTTLEKKHRPPGAKSYLYRRRCAG